LSSTGGDHLNLTGLVLDGNGIPLPDGRGLVHLAHGRAVRIADCEIVNAGRNGVTLEATGDDGTMVLDNRIENVANKSGGSGQYGNGVAIFRADNVIVRGNRIRKTAFSAV